MIQQKFHRMDFLLIWADDDTEQGVLHTNFKFNSSGDDVYLFAGRWRNTFDSVSLDLKLLMFLYGRSHDASPLWVNFL